jgi:UDP-N-acetyl-D-mannosaminuronic acid dehydrogenase
MNFNHVCIMGLGYIGLPTACMFASNGIRVTGVDVNEHIVQTLNQGKTHIKEPGLDPVFQAALLSGLLTVKSYPEPADAFIITVPTPFYENKKADMRAVTSATEMIVPYLRAGNVVVLESTSPPRTTVELVQPILERSGLKGGKDFLLVYSPERVLPGQIIKELAENARVIGGIDTASAEAGRELYAIFVKGEIILTDATTAEMIKLMENTYRDINIAIANEFARIADRFGVNVWEAISIANKHPRVKILNPGPGVGGHCISVDPWFLVEAAPDLTPLVRTARQVNDAQPHFVVDLVRRAEGSLIGKRIAVLGLAFKADVDDLRESPAIEIVHSLNREGAHPLAYDPYALEANPQGIQLATTLNAALESAELILVLVRHRQFLELTPSTLVHMTAARRVIDAVNAWSGNEWPEAGFEIHTLGAGSKQHAPAIEL